MGDLVERRARTGFQRPHVARAQACRPEPLAALQADSGLLRQRGSLGLQVVDDGVDLVAGGAQMVVHLRVELPAYFVLTFANGLLARPKLPLGLVDGGAFLRERAAILLEGAQVVVDAGEVL